ncbi:hypothetical protein CPB86DRAFT_877782 [Serendipita vermifera]|nr:hypothetical protein CPB86DRAFT_877782 [Serendipita vermifera]
MEVSPTALDSPSVLRHEHDITTQVLATTSAQYELDHSHSTVTRAINGDNDHSGHTQPPPMNEGSIAMSMSFATANPTSLCTSASSSSSGSSSDSDAIPTRPSSPQGWTYHGDWSVGEPLLITRSDSQPIHTGELERDDPTHDVQQLLDRLSVPRWVFPTTFPYPEPTPQKDLRTNLDMMPRADWVFPPGVKQPTPTISNARHVRWHSDQDKDHACIFCPKPFLPMILVTAPSSSPPSVYSCPTDEEEAGNSLTIHFSPRSGKPIESIEMEVLNSSYSSQQKDSRMDHDDEENVALSTVKRNLQQLRRPTLESKSNILRIFTA